MNKTSRTLQTGYKFFVLRRKLSNSESTEKFEDVFCIVPDSNVLINPIDEDSTNEKKTRCQTVEEPFIQHGPTSNDAFRERHYDPSIKKEFNLQLFRSYLMTFFNVDLDSTIFYMDENNKVHEVQTEIEFLQLWKLAKSYAKHNRGVLLLIDFTYDLNNDMSKDIISFANDQTFSRKNKIVFSVACQSDETTTELKKNNDAQHSTEYENRIFHLVDERSNNLFQSMNDTSTLLENETESSSKILTNTEKMGDAEVESTVPFITNSQDFKNNVPPTWFVNYMEQLKKVIVKEVLDQIMANKLENWNTYLTRSPMDTQDEHIFPLQNCARNHQNSTTVMDENDTIESMTTIKDVKPDTAIKNETINKSDSTSSELAEPQLCVKERLYKSNIPEENDCCMKYHTDEFGFKSKTCCCDDMENISINSDIDNKESVSNEDNFEIIPKPLMNENSCNYVSKKSFLQKIAPYFDKRTRGSNTQNCAIVESPTKERLISSSSIYIDDNHFTACSNNIPTSKNINFNILSAHESDENSLIVYKDDNEKIFQNDVSDESIDNNAAILSKNICQTLVEMSSKIQVPNPETKCSENTDFETTQCYCQADLTNLNDITPNFHSHTASIAESSVDIKENNNSHDYSKHNLLYSSKPTNTKENRIHKQTSDNFNYGNPEKKLSKKKSNATYWCVFEDSPSNSTAENAEPVHILPETLVTGAVHLASFAYGTAREAITKIRSNSKDDQ